MDEHDGCGRGAHECIGHTPQPKPTERTPAMRRHYYQALGAMQDERAQAIDNGPFEHRCVYFELRQRLQMRNDLIQIYLCVVLDEPIAWQLKIGLQLRIEFGQRHIDVNKLQGNFASAGDVHCQGQSVFSECRPVERHDY
jgi:hypothetical protein